VQTNDRFDIFPRELTCGLRARVGAADASAENKGEVDAKLHWDGHILGLDKRDLLRNVVLPALAENRAMQRFVGEYTDLLGALERKDANPLTIPSG
jgi:hypothetical protein